MLNIIKIEGKNEQEILETYLKDNCVSEKDIYYSISALPTKLFKSKKIMISILSKKDVIIYLKEFINELSKKMNIEIKYEINYKNDSINILLISDNNSILIGKDGRTLNSLQILFRQLVSSQSPFPIKINLDVSNYKANKLKNLEYEIKKIVKEVNYNKISVTLDPMNSYERRLVHNIVSDYPNLESKSDGEGKERKITISYKN